MATNRYLLQSEIHQERNREFLATGYFPLIRDLLDEENENDVNFIKNHIGRELFKKLYLYGLTSSITDSYDAGFRPITITGIFAPATPDIDANAILTEDELALLLEDGTQLLTQAGPTEDEFISSFGGYVTAASVSQELYNNFGSIAPTTIKYE